MNAFIKTAIATVFVVTSSVSFAFGTSNQPSVPGGWTKIQDNGNVQIYQKGTEQTYMQAIDIKNGGKLQFVQVQNGTDTFGRKLFQRKNVVDWYAYVGNNPPALVNAQYFNTAINPTTLSFGVKSNGVIITRGDDIKPKLRQLEIYNNWGAIVRDYAPSFFDNASTTDMIVGYDHTVDISASGRIGRTMVCVPGFYDPYPYVLILSTYNYTRSDAIAQLSNWNCVNSRVIQFDGSGSSQLKTSGGKLMYGLNSQSTVDKRTFPQAIVSRNN